MEFSEQLLRKIVHDIRLALHVLFHHIVWLRVWQNLVKYY